MPLKYDTDLDNSLSTVDDPSMLSGSPPRPRLRFCFNTCVAMPRVQQGSASTLAGQCTSRLANYLSIVACGFSNSRLSYQRSSEKGDIVREYLLFPEPSRAAHIVLDLSPRMEIHTGTPSHHMMKIDLSSGFF